jgi:soluble lytic murein transglycosylase-like protein
MQLMPGTARAMEKQLGMPDGETDRNPAANAYAGRVYRDQLYADAMKKTGDPAISMQYALSAYNAGPAGLNRQINSGKLKDETANYGKSIAKKAGAMGNKPQARVQGAPMQTRGMNASLATNADRFLLGKQ